MKSSKNMVAGYALLTGILAFSFYGLGQSLASGGYQADYYDLDHEHHEAYGDNGRQVSVDPGYREECGSCHMAFPAALLPAGSWQGIMTGLEDHFGENAQLDAQTREQIENYLVRESVRMPYRKLFRNLGDATPLRITGLPYFVHEHDEIPEGFVTGNAGVGSLARCNACHRDAESGRFDEDEVVIPGVGRWDD